MPGMRVGEWRVVKLVCVAAVVAAASGRHRGGRRKSHNNNNNNNRYKQEKEAALERNKASETATKVRLEKARQRRERDEAVSSSAVGSLYECFGGATASPAVVACQRACAWNVSCGSIVVDAAGCAQRREYLDAFNGDDEHRYFSDPWKKKRGYCAQHPRGKTKEASVDWKLIDRLDRVAVLPRGAAYRYFSLVRRRDGRVDLTARTGRYPDATPHEEVVVWRDVGVDFKGVTETAPVPIPNLRSQHSASKALRDAAHNYAFLKKRVAPEHPRVYGGRGEVAGLVHAVMHPDLTRGRFSEIQVVVEANHTGCVEAVFESGSCRYDGKVSAVEFKGRIWLYLRLNQGYNARWLQVTHSRSSPTGPFGPLTPIRVAGWRKCDVARASVYFASVNPNPLDVNSLLAFLPVHLDDACTMYLTLTCDGLHFAPPVRLLGLRCIEEGRVAESPVDGLLEDDQYVYVYVHASMPTSSSISRPSFDPALDRYALKKTVLADFVRRAKRRSPFCQASSSEFKKTTKDEATIQGDAFADAVHHDDSKLSTLTSTCERERVARAVVQECSDDGIRVYRRFFSPLTAEIVDNRTTHTLDPTPCPLSSSHKAAFETNAAVCVAGGGRNELFLSDAVQKGFRDVLHRPGYEYFLSLDAYLPLNDPRLLIPPVAAWSDSDEDPRYSRQRCPVKTANHRFLVPMARRLAKCAYLITRREASRRQRYDYLLRIRPDHLFLKSPPPVAEWLRSGLGASNGLLLYDDQIALGPRSALDAILLGPQAVYIKCFGADDWAAACRADVVDRKSSERSPSEIDLDNIRHTVEAPGNNVPCCPMNLVVHSPSFKKASLSDVRQCKSIKHPTCVIDRCDVDLLRSSSSHGLPRTEYGCLAAAAS